MGDLRQPINNNGFMRDIYSTTRNEYIETNEPIIFNNRREYSLKGIIQETPLSNLFFSDINIKVLQMTIRYHIFTEKNKKPGGLSKLRKNLARSLTLINQKKRNEGRG